MTVQEIREAAKVMEAYANGKKIQYLNDDNEWIDAPNPLFDWGNCVYRIKPEPKYRPFRTQEECWNEMHKHPDFGWVKRMKEPAYLSLNKIEEIGRVDGWDFSDIFKHITFTDGEPFGVKEE